MRDVEIDMVVPSSIEALALYKQIFDIEVVGKKELESGVKEAFFKMYGVGFRLLDEDPEQKLVAPKKADPKPMWIKLTVSDIEEVYARAMDNGSTEIQGITLLEAFGLSNAVFVDKFGYKWMLHQEHREVRFEDKGGTSVEKMHEEEDYY
jgi:uncharacterized glyoxalase superfamily protein PhnB